MTNSSDWIMEEFATANIGDVRLDERLKMVVKSFIEKPGESIFTISKQWSDAKGAYRFFSNSKVKIEKILKPHTESTMKRLQGKKIVLAPSDTTDVIYEWEREIEKLGPVANQHSQGFVAHPTLAVSTDGTPLGILDLQVWTRKKHGDLKDRKFRSIKDKESIKWIRSYRELCALENANKNIHFVNICDREGDIYELFFEYHKNNLEHKPDLLIRSCWDRRIVSENNEMIWERVSSQEIFSTYSIIVPRRKDKPSRKAELELRFCELIIRPPKNRKIKGAENIKLYVIHTKEIDAPKDEDPVSWTLLTTMPVLNFDDAIEKIEWYLNRWMIELLFKALKSCCNTEKRQLRTANRLKNVVAIDFIIAWRLLFITFIGRECPDLPASLVFHEDELKVLHIKVNENKPLIPENQNLGKVILQIAKLGGFMGRNSDGFPGMMVILKGLYILNELTSFWKIINQQPPTYG